MDIKHAVKTLNIALEVESETILQALLSISGSLPGDMPEEYKTEGVKEVMDAIVNNEPFVTPLMAESMAGFDGKPIAIMKFFTEDV
jgi:hypothetical protein